MWLTATVDGGKKKEETLDSGWMSDNFSTVGQGGSNEK
jgi:hypothetical protein